MKTKDLALKDQVEPNKQIKIKYLKNSLPLLKKKDLKKKKKMKLLGIQWERTEY